MATTLNEIHELIGVAGMSSEIRDGYVVVCLTTRQYTDGDKDHAVILLVDADEQGKFIKIFTPILYTNNQPEHELAILRTCMQVSSHTKMVRYEYGSQSGHIGMQIEIPLEDNHLTVRQLLRAISCMVLTIDNYDCAFR